MVSGVQKYMNKTVFLLWGSEKKSDEFQISKVKGYFFEPKNPVTRLALNISYGGKIVGSKSVGIFPGTFPIFKSQDFWTSLVLGQRDHGTFKVSRSCPV